jgi:hypothetical protein
MLYGVEWKVDLSVKVYVLRKYKQLYVGPYLPAVA